MKSSGLSEIDNKIAEMLRGNARLSFSEIGKTLGISRVSVRKRVEQMEKSGIISGYHAEIHPDSLPQGIQFVLDIEAIPQYYTEVISKLSLISMIHKIYGASGKSRIHAAGMAPNSETLGTFANHLFRSTRGIRDLSWQILVTTYKDTEKGVEYEIRHQEYKYMEGRLEKRDPETRE